MDEEDVVFSFYLLVCCAALVHLKHMRHRRYKVRPINRQRHRYGHFHRRVQLMKTLQDDEQYVKFTRMSPAVFDNLLGILGPALQKDVIKLLNASLKSFQERLKIQQKCPISPAERLTISLHNLVEGCSMQKVATDFYIGKATAHCIIKETCSVIWDSLSSLYLSPPTHYEFIKISKGFYNRWNMPNCLGALYGKHVHIQAPKHSGSDYFNYKKSSRYVTKKVIHWCLNMNTFSIVLMAVCDAFYKFNLVDISAYGSQYDSIVFSDSPFGSAILHRQREILDLPHEMALSNTDGRLPYFLWRIIPLHEEIMRPYPG
ncbi:hypothetical protein PPYR_15346 [Photinus pyralis]|uniref:Uncharacterized protein n=1 Tax=Photinus pyralis TaxID=7054 RepID=A0A5N3ZZ22_PHOPY|nr:hypothetical protein PPYR_15346 [Photinus pyralis]